MNGVVFQTSTRIAPARSSVLSESIGWLMMPSALTT